MTILLMIGSLIMNKPKLLNKFTRSQLRIIARSMNVYFNLVDRKRIYHLILQVDSIDTALHLLFCHKESATTLDAIVFDWLYKKDDKYE